MATRRSKPSIKKRPKFRQERSLATRRRKAKASASRRRSLGKAKAARMRRGKLKKRMSSAA